METGPGPKWIEGLTGTVETGPLGEGSKSERQAYFLQTPEGRFVLRRKEGPTFGDKALQRYVGRSVNVDGFVVDYALLAERIEEAD